MEGFNGRNIFDKIKKWYDELSRASKFVIILSIILFISNVIINIWSCKTYQDVEQAVNNIDTNELLKYFWFIEIFDKIKESVNYLI